jgi:hypothetical protein
MKSQVLLCAGVLLFSSLLCSAVIITPFSDVDLYCKRGKDIIIAECVPTWYSLRPTLHGQFHHPDVDVLKVLKGDAEMGRREIASLYPIEPGRKYLLYSLGGLVEGIDFITTAELSVVEIPQDFSISILDARPLNEQVAMLFAARLRQIGNIPTKNRKEIMLLEMAKRNKGDRTLKEIVEEYKRTHPSK